jgi:hypothetical protein
VIAKVPVKRTDGKSSFAALTGYITRNAAALFHSKSVWSIETAAEDMAGVALRNERVKDAVYHYVLSWRDGENPSDMQAFDSMIASLTALNMQDHQWIGAVHRDTAHVHAHVAVSRINPDTFKSVYPKGDWIVLDRTCRELEVKHGWEHSPGPHRVSVAIHTAPEIVRSRYNLSDDQRANITTRARDFSAWTGLGSFQDWVGREPAALLRGVLERPNLTWPDIHRSLATFNLEYRRTGSGAVVVDRHQPEKFHAKASHVARFASLPRLEARLGQYEPQKDKGPSHDRTPAQSAECEARSYRRRVEGRSLRRDHRKAQREALYERYVATKSEWDRSQRAKLKLAWSQHRLSEKTRFEALRVENREARSRIRGSTRTANKRILYSIQAYISAAKREALRVKVAGEREELKAKLNRGRPGTWREWLATQAVAGDRAAVKALRGLRYRERRERSREMQPLGIITTPEAPRKTLLTALRWTADERGVNYFRENIAVFRDEGQRVVFTEIGDDNIRAGLMLCREKWTRELYINGTKEFKSKASALAAQMGIRMIDQDVKVQKQVGERSNGLPLPHGKALQLIALDVEHLATAHGKPAVISAPRIGKQHTGKLVAIGRDIQSHGIVVIDAGRELAVIHATVRTVTDLEPKVGEHVRAQSTALEWRFLDFQRPGQDLKHVRRLMMQREFTK